MTKQSQKPQRSSSPSPRRSLEKSSRLEHENIQLKKRLKVYKLKEEKKKAEREVRSRQDNLAGMIIDYAITYAKRMK